MDGAPSATAWPSNCTSAVGKRLKLEPGHAPQFLRHRSFDRLQLGEQPGETLPVGCDQVVEQAAYVSKPHLLENPAEALPAQFAELAIAQHCEIHVHRIPRKAERRW